MIEQEEVKTITYVGDIGLDNITITYEDPGIDNINKMMS